LDTFAGDREFGDPHCQGAVAPIPAQPQTIAFFDFNADSIPGDSPCPNTRRSNYVCLDALDGYRRARKKPAVAG
jgi:hypothetical protein